MSYGNLIIKIMEHTGFNFVDEDYKEETTKIGKSVLPTMTFEIINRKVTEKPPQMTRKEKKIIKKYP